MSVTRLFRRPNLFYGWWMVALGGFITSLNKAAVNKGFPVFILPVEEFFGASRAQVSFIFALARSENGPTGPLAGWLVDRFGPRAALFLGAAMTGGGFLILGQTRSIWAFALIYLGVITIGSNIGVCRCTFLDIGLRRCDGGSCPFRLHHLTHCRLPKQTLGFSLM